MSEILLTLIVPADVARQVEDLLLEHPELVSGFTSRPVAGHGSAVQLVEPAELVSGHSPRMQVQTVGEESRMQAVLALLRDRLPHANIFYWLMPVLESGRIV